MAQTRPIKPNEAYCLFLEAINQGDGIKAEFYRQFHPELEKRIRVDELPKIENVYRMAGLAEAITELTENVVQQTNKSMAKKIGLEWAA